MFLSAPASTSHPKLRLQSLRAAAAAWSLLLAFGWATPPARAQTTITFTSGQNSTTAYDTSGGALTFTIASGTATQSGTVTGAPGITKTGAGTLVLAGTGDNNGLTATVNAGTLVLAKDSVRAIGGVATSVTINGGMVQLGGTGGDQIFDWASVAVNSGGRFELNGRSEAINNLTGVGTVDNFQTAITSSLTVGANNGSSTFDGVIKSTIALTKTGTGTFTLTNPQLYTGGTTVSQGTLTLSGFGRLPDNDFLTVATGATVNLSSSSTTLYGLSGGGTLNVNGGALTVGQGSVSSAFSGTINGGAALSKTGGGEFTLGGTADNPSLTATVFGGTLILAKSSSSSVHAIGGGGTSVSVRSGATLLLAGTGGDQIFDWASVDVSSGGTFNLNGRNEALNNLTGGGTVKAGNGAATLTLGANNGSSIFEGVMQDGGSMFSLTKIGTGTLTLSGISTYTGATTLSGGTLRVSGANRLPNLSAVKIASGATLDLNGNSAAIGSLAGAGNVTLGAGTLTTGGDATSTTFSGVISGTGGLTKTSSGTLTLAAAQTYTGPTTLSGGTLKLSGSGQLPDSTALTLSPSATFDLNGISATIGSLAGGGAGTGVVSLGSGTLTVGTDNSSTNFSGFIGGTGGLTKVGSGTLTLSRQSSYFGLTTISGGTLQIGDNGTTGSISSDIVNNASLVFARSGDYGNLLGLISGTGSVTQNSPSTVGTLGIYSAHTYTGATNIATGIVKLFGGRLPDASAVTIGASGTFDLNNYSDTIGSLAGAGRVILGSATLTTGGDNTSTTFSGNISGTGGLTKQGTGTLTLSGGNSYTGTTTLSAGTLALGSGVALGSSGSIYFGGGTLQFSANNTTDYSARFSTGAGQAYSLDTNGQSVTLASALTSSGGSLTKLGTGTLTLSTANTFSGNTTVSGGTLLLGHSLALQNSTFVAPASGALSFGSLATATLGGLTGSHALALANASSGAVALTAGNNNASTTYSGALSGAGSLTKTGTGTLTLSGTNTHTGGTTISTGTLQIGAGGATGSLTGNVVNNGALVFNRSDAAAYAGVISGTGPVTQAGTGTLTLSGNNTYSGGTIISAGTLQIGAGGTSGSLAGNVTNNAALTFNRSDATTFSDVISGTGSLTKTGGGTLTLSGANTYTGGTTISAGTLQLGNGGTTGSIAGNVTNNAALMFNRSDATSFSGAISGTGSVTKTGADTLTFLGANTYTGGTTISAGTLQIGNGGTTGSLVGNVTNNAALTFNRSDNTSFSGAISGTGSVTKTGAGTLTLSGANSYSGGTTLAGGTLALGSSGALGTSGILAFNGGTLQFSPNNTTDYSARFSSAANQTYNLDTNGQSVTLATALSSSSASLRKTGSGTLTLSGANTYAGGTTISAGTLQIGNGGTTGAIAGDVTNNAALTFNRSDATSFSGAISGTGALTKTGAGTLTLSGANTYTGGTTLSGGTLALGSGGALGSTGTISFGGGTLQFSANNTTDYSSRFSTAAGQAFRFDTNGQNVTFAAALMSLGGSLVKSGAGTLTLSGGNTFTGGTTISEGTLQIGNGGSTGTISGSIANNAALVFNRSTAFSFGGAISGTGSLTMAGTNQLTLSGNNTYTGGTILAAGTLTLNSSGALGSAGTVTFNGGTLQFSANNATDYSARFSPADNQTYRLNTNGQNVTLASALTSSGGSLNKLGAGTLTLTGANTYAGVTTIAAGTLQVGAGSTSGALAGDVVNQAALVFNRSNALTYAGAISGNGTLTQSGAGTLTLTGNNTYSGATTISAGTLQIGSGGNSGSLASSNVVNNAALVFNRSGATTFSGVISGTGSVTQAGAGTLTLSGINSYTGITQVAAGNLKITGSAANSAFIVSGGILSGSGTVGALTIASGGTISPGNSPGTLSAGATTFAGGGSFIFEINNATGSAGTNWDLLSISGALAITANSSSKFTVNLTSLTLGNVAGPAANFNPASNYTFNFVTATGGISGFTTDAFTLDTSGFQNAFTGTWSIASSANALSLTYTASAIPEPSTYAALAGLLALTAAAIRRRRAG